MCIVERTMFNYIVEISEMFIFKVFGLGSFIIAGIEYFQKLVFKTFVMFLLP